MKATKRLIDSVWTIEYEIVSPLKVKILKYTRKDIEGYEKEKQLPKVTTIEGENRTLTHIMVGEYVPYSIGAENSKNVTTYEVINPDHIFSYEN